MGRTGGYYREGEYIEATPEELAARKEARGVKRGLKDLTAKVNDRDAIHNFVEHGWEPSPGGGISARFVPGKFRGSNRGHDLDAWQGTRGEPSNYLETTGPEEKSLMKQAGEVVGNDPKAQARFLDLAKSHYRKLSAWYDNRFKYWLGKGEFPDFASKGYTSLGGKRGRPSIASIKKAQAGMERQAQRAAEKANKAGKIDKIPAKSTPRAKIGTKVSTPKSKAEKVNVLWNIGDDKRVVSKPGKSSAVTQTYDKKTKTWKDS